MLIKGKSMLQSVLDVFRKANVDRVVVVLGANERRVRKTVKFDREKIIVNRSYAKGLSSSLRLGVAKAGPEAEAVIVALGDQPFVSPSTIVKLIEGYRNSHALVVIPVHRGTRGNPVLLDRRLFQEVGKIRGDVGAKSIFESRDIFTLEVPVRDKGVTIDIDTPKDYESALDHSK